MDTFQGRTASTLVKRGYSLMAFLRWGRPVASGKLLPFQEKTVYEYFRHLRATGAPATRASAFLQAMGVAEDLLEFEGEGARSKRVRGAASQMWSTKRPLQQREPLSPSMLAVFEDQAERNPDVRTRVFCGWIAALTHWRARFSDGMWPAEEPTLDKAATGREVYVETTAQSERQKTGRSRKKARRTVFMVGFAHGVRGNPWARAWLEARKECGVSVKSHGALMPMPHDGGFLA